MQMQKGFDAINLHGTASGVIATPYIGENENWWIGNEDTRINARGEKGDQGEPGLQGPKGDQAADMSRIEALEAKYEQLNSDLAISHNQRVNMSTYNSSSNYYVCQSNGILTMYASGNTTSSIDLFYIDDTNTVIELYSKAGNNSRHDTLYFPIYKGFKIYVVKAGISEVFFYPFV